MAYRPLTAVLLVAVLVVIALPSLRPTWAGDVAAEFPSPFLGPDGRIRTLYRPEFRDALGLRDDLVRFGVEGLLVETTGPMVSSPQQGKPPVPSRLLLAGDPEVVARAREVLRYLDSPRPSIYVSLLVAEVRSVDQRERGGHFFLDRITPGESPDTIFRGLASNYEPESWLRSSLTGIMPFQGTSVRFANAMDDIVENGAFELVLRMLSDQRQAEFLAWPTVLCTEGEKGAIATLVQTPHRRVVASGSVGILVDSQTIGTGILLQVVPVRIARDAAVLDLVVDVNYEAPETSSDIPVSPVLVRRRKVATRITIRDGESMLIGGLKIKRRGRRQQGVPVLSRIPVVREGTSSGSREVVESELLLLVKGRVLVPGRSVGPFVPPGEAHRLAAGARARRKAEAEAQGAAKVAAPR